MHPNKKIPDSADKLVSSMTLGIMTRSTFLTAAVTLVVIGGMILFERIGN